MRKGREVFHAEALQAAVRSHLSAPVNFYVEYLESQRFGSRDYENRLSETLRDAYAKQKLDLIIVAAYPALRFATQFRERMFPGVPIVFTSVAPGRIQGHPLWRGVTGITIPVDVRGTLDLALRLNPDTKNVAMVAGNSEFESYWLEMIHQEIRPVEVDYQGTDLGSNHVKNYSAWQANFKCVAGSNFNFTFGSK